MKLNEYISNFNLTENTLYIGSLFNDTLNLLNANEAIMLDLDYEVIKAYEDEGDYIAEISNADYQELIKKLNAKKEA